MTIAIGAEHGDLAKVARALLDDQGAGAQHRAMLDAPADSLPPLWPHLAEVGWLGLHLPEDVGGSGYGLPELAVVLDELGRAAAPGPFLPTVLGSAIIADAGTPAQRRALLPGLADGTSVAGFGPAAHLAIADTVDGDGGVVMSAAVATHLVLRTGDDVVVVAAAHDGVEI